MARIRKHRIKYLRKHFIRFLVFVFIASALITGYVGWHSHTQAPYQWSREGNTYTNPYYGLQITKKEGWLRSLEGPTLERQLFISRFYENPIIPFTKRDLIEFHRFGETQQLDATVLIGPVDDLKGKPYGRSLRDYAQTSVMSMGATKIWVKKAQIELTELNGLPCAKANVSYELPKVGELEGEFYFFIKGARGFNVVYATIPSEFDTYRDEAIGIIQSIRFTEEGSSLDS